MYRQAYLELQELQRTNPALAEKVANEILGGMEKVAAEATPSFAEIMEKVASVYPSEVEFLQKLAFNFADAMHAQGLSPEELEKKLQQAAFKNDPVGAIGKKVSGVAEAAGGAATNAAGTISDTVLGAGDTLKDGLDGAGKAALTGVDWLKANPGKAALIGGGAAGAGVSAVALLNAIRNSKDEKVAAIWDAFIEKKASAEDPNFGDRLIGNVKFDSGEKSLGEDHGYALLANIIAGMGTAAIRSKNPALGNQLAAPMQYATNVSRGVTAAGANDTPYGLSDAALNAFLSPFSTGETRAKKHLRNEEAVLDRVEKREAKEASVIMNEILKFAGVNEKKI